jgi:hypothetical protein
MTPAEAMDSLELKAARNAGENLGIAFEVVADGSMIAVLTQTDTTTPREQAAKAARCALRIRDAWPCGTNRHSPRTRRHP